MLKFFLIVLSVLSLSSPLLADLQRANVAIQQYEKDLSLWQTSVKAAAITGQKPLVNAPNKTKVAQKVWKEVAPQLSKEESFPAVIWLYENAASFLKGALAGAKPNDQINRAIQRYHFKSDKIDQLLLAMAQRAGPAELETIKQVKEQNPNEIQRGVASLALSMALAGMDDASAVKQRLASLREAVKLVPSKQDLGNYDFEQLVGDQLYWITSLSKGKVAPEFSLVNAKGESFSLKKNAKGVTVLFFVRDSQLGEEQIRLRIQQLRNLLEEVQGTLVIISNGRGGAEAEQALIDEQAEVFEQYRISQTPYVIVMDSKQRLQLRSEPTAFVDLTVRALNNAEE